MSEWGCDPGTQTFGAVIGGKARLFLPAGLWGQEKHRDPWVGSAPQILT